MIIFSIFAAVVQRTRERTRPIFNQFDNDTNGDQVRIHLLAIASIFIIILPIIVAIIVSTKESGIVTSVTELVPGTSGSANYQRAVFELGFWRFMLNSFIMSMIIVVGKLFVSLLAALAIVYYRLPYKNLIFLFILFTLLLPVPVRFVPLYRLAVDIGWNNSFLAITVPYIASATTVFILRQHFLSISESLVETAKIDGVGPIRFLTSVLIPMSRGILIGVSVIMFVFAWNQYLWPLVIIDTEGQQVAQVGLNILRGQASSGEVAWSMVMTGSVLTLVPPLALLIIFRNALIETFTIQQK
jgi:sn-glycerol 3-phosphate transport system permease protein|uniref:Sn-glycerol-3-phosphate transport system permease n=1 Tax=uncultured haloarchaeon TaxID=160804 RepID=A5YST4_9EURY|nr:Sn-glycerol-3-phosphate transport system permease [uncultured haloarchaeon]